MGIIKESRVTDNGQFLNKSIYGCGTVKYKKNGLLHRSCGPAIIEKDGTVGWYYSGKLHRSCGPAIIEKDGTEGWYYKGKLHRYNGPAKVLVDGTELWYHHGTCLSNNDVKQRKLVLCQ